MAKLSVFAGATSQSVNVFVQDSSSTTGAGLTGLVFNSSGLTAYYTFAGTNAGATAISLATLAAVNSAWASGGFKEIDSTNMPGMYRLDLPNAVLAASKGRSVAAMLKGAASMAPCPLEIELTGTDNQDAVRGGLTALPSTPCTANASLITSGTGADQLSVTGGRAKADVNFWNGTVVATPATAGIPDVNAKNIAGQAAALDAFNRLQVDVESFGGASGTFAGGRPEVNVSHWRGNAVPATTVSGVPEISVKYWRGLTVPATAQPGIPDVNTIYWLGTAPATPNNAGVPIVDAAYFVGHSITCPGGVVLGSFIGNANAAIAVTATGIVSADIQTIKTQAVTCSAGVTVAPFVGNSTHALAVDSSGFVTFNNATAPAGFITAASIASGALIVAVWDGLTSGHTGAGTFGNALVSAASAGDPWLTNLPGSYIAGQAGFIMGTFINAAITSRLATAGYTAPPTAATIADTTLRRTMAHVQASSDGDPISLNSLYGFIQMGQSSSQSGGVWTVKNPDATTLGTRVLTTDVTALPITGVA